MNWGQFKDPVSHLCVAGAVVPSWSVTLVAAGSNLFDDKFSENIWRKLNFLTEETILESEKSFIAWKLTGKSYHMNTSFQSGKSSDKTPSSDFQLSNIFHFTNNHFPWFLSLYGSQHRIYQWEVCQRVER